MEIKTVQDNDIYELAKEWRLLQISLVRKNDLAYEDFVRIFSQTYVILKDYASQTKVDKAHMKLIINAYSFANMQAGGYDERAYAAFVLTERMLQCCVMDTRTDKLPQDGVAIYFLGQRREALIRFENVDEAINEIIEGMAEE